MRGWLKLRSMFGAIWMASMAAKTAAMPRNFPTNSSLAYCRRSGCFNRSANRVSFAENFG